MLLSACMILVFVAISTGSSLARGTHSTGSSCAHPYRATFTLKAGNNSEEVLPTRSNPINISLIDTSRPRSIDWSVVRKGYMICQVRIALQNGGFGKPSRLFPFTTPMPTAGEYDETANPASRIRSVEVMAAKAPIPPGGNCNFPLETRRNQDESHSGDSRDFTVEILFRSTGEVEFGEPVRVQLKVTVFHPERVELCPKARIGDILRGKFEHGHVPVRDYYVPIPPNGGLSPVISVERGEGFGANVYARLKR